MIMNKIIISKEGRVDENIGASGESWRRFGQMCKAVFDEVKRDGDEALKKYTWYFDRVKLECFEVTEEEFQEAEKAVKKGVEGGDTVAKGILRSFIRFRFQRSVNT